MDTRPPLQTQTSQVKPLPSADEEKVSNITEVCNVSREEAVRVLDACRMDETMAIERFLSGKEVSTWSRVSKKKKSSQQQRSMVIRSGASGFVRSQDRDQDRHRNRYRNHDVDRRDVDLHSHHVADLSLNHENHRRGVRHNTQVLPSGRSQKLKDSSSFERRQVHQMENIVGSSEVGVPSSEEGARSWGVLHHNEKPIDNLEKDSNMESDKHLSPSGNWPKAPKKSVTVEIEGNVNHVTHGNAWVTQKQVQAHSSSKNAVETELVALTSPAIEGSPKLDASALSKVKRTINYAAAVAAGTSHAKPGPAGETLEPVSGSTDASSILANMEVTTGNSPSKLSTEGSADVRKKRARPVKKTRTRTIAETDAPEIEADLLISNGNGLSTSIVGTGPANLKSSPNVDSVDENSASRPWGGTDLSNGLQEKRREDSVISVVEASTADSGADNCSSDSLSLQFGSFGLSGLDNVNWSAPGRRAAKSTLPKNGSTSSGAVAPVIGSAATSTVSSTPMATSGGPPVISISSPGSRQENNSIPSSVEVRGQSVVGSSSVPTSSIGGSGSGVFPMLPVGPAGSFAPANFGAPYLMPPLPGYSPALGSYDAAADLASSRAPNPGPPGSLPLYDPGVLSTLTSGNSKFGGIPGLGEVASLPASQNAMGKDTLHSNGELEKNVASSSSALPSSIDPLNTPYVMHGYPSMQYPPIYTFPNAAYPPPTLAPGPSHFSYAPGGQVSSQAGRGGFGFEENSTALALNSRAGSGLAESTYSPGGYLNSTITNTHTQKATNDTGGKQVRDASHPGNSLGGIGMAGGVVHGMAFRDYGNVTGVSSGSGSEADGNVSWSSRQANGGRFENMNVSNAGSQALGGSSQNPTVYSAGPGVLPSAYWSPQHGGYYS